MVLTTKFVDGSMTVTRTSEKFTGNPRALALALAGLRPIRRTYVQR